MAQFPYAAQNPVGTATGTTAITLSPPQPAEPSVVDELSCEVERLALVISNTELRLGKVLTPDYNNDGLAGAEPAPVVSGIRVVQECLTAQIDRLNRLIARVEA